MKIKDGKILKHTSKGLLMTLPALFLVGCLDNGGSGGVASLDTTNASLGVSAKAKVGVFVEADPTTATDKKVVVSLDRVSMRDDNGDSVSAVGSGQQVDLTSQAVALPNLSLSGDQSLATREVRLILMDTGNEYTRSDSSVCELKTPSAQQSGLKIKLPDTFSFQPGLYYSIHLSFDVDKSVVDLGNGGCLLKPVIKGEIIAYKPPVDDSGNDSNSSDSNNNNSGGDSSGSSGGTGDVSGGGSVDPVVDYQPVQDQVVDIIPVSVSN